jgi:arabinose-5-phosphate isomerase
MTTQPRTLPFGARVGEAMELLQRHKISEVPIVDEAGRPIGLIDITDLIGVGNAVEEEEQPPLRIGA